MSAPNIITPWTLKNIQNLFEKSKNINDLKAKLHDDIKYTSYKTQLSTEDLSKYDVILQNNFQLSDFYNNTFLGFSYIEPELANDTAKKKFFSSIFRTINVSASPLTNLESREALYWIDADKVPFLKPDFINNFKVSGKIYDFVRCLAFVSEFNELTQSQSISEKKAQSISEKKVAVGFGNRNHPYEEYFELYVNIVINPDFDSITKFTKYSINQKDQISELKNALQILCSTNKNFSNIFEADYLFFGLTYWIVFQNKSLKNLNNDDKIAVSTKLNDLKNRAERDYGKSPNRIGAIRKRIYDSIGCLEGYML